MLLVSTRNVGLGEVVTMPLHASMCCIMADNYSAVTDTDCCIYEELHGLTGLVCAVLCTQQDSTMLTSPLPAEQYVLLIKSQQMLFDSVSDIAAGCTLR